MARRPLMSYVGIKLTDGELVPGKQPVGIKLPYVL
jgi:hypothetical protein